jgi:hypothetical protein
MHNYRITSQATYTFSQVYLISATNCFKKKTKLSKIDFAACTIYILISFRSQNDVDWNYSSKYYSTCANSCKLDFG